MLTVPNDSYYYAQWGLKNNGTFNLSPAVAGADIKMEQAWDIETGDSDIIVAVMDSGLKLDHPEFAGRLWINTGEIPNNGVDDDLNGYIDDINGWDFAYGDNIPADDYGHGTNVTGIIAANGNNNLGYTGVDMACKIMTLKGLDATNYGYYSWWNNAIRYAADNGADVINLSVGGNTFSALLLGATNYAIAQGTTVVVSMGNGNNNIPTYPAANLNVIAVGSTNPDDTRTAPFFWDVNSGSNFGPHISVVAPGNYIYGLSHTSNTNYGTYWGGTSQAAPLVTGLACLLKAQDPSRTPAQIRTIIRNTADDQVGNLLEDTPGFDMYYGYGRINAFKALSVALSTDKFETEDNLVKIYPNPSSGVFTVQTTSNADIVVYNALGQRIFAKAISPSDNKITIEQEGIYFVTANCNGNKTAAKLVVE